MNPTTQDRNTPYKDGRLVVLGVAANAIIRAGVIVCANSDGYIVEGTTANNLTYIGCSQESVDATGCLDGEKQISIKRGYAFNWASSGDDPVTISRLGKLCYIVDNQSVAASDDGGDRSAAGTVIGFNENGVWVV